VTEIGTVKIILHNILIATFWFISITLLEVLQYTDTFVVYMIYWFRSIFSSFWL